MSASARVIATARGQVRLCRDTAALSHEAALYFAEAAAQAVAERGRFAVALSGGSTPKSLYSLLAGDEFRGRISWGQAHFFWGDERCVPPDDPQSNYRMAHETLLARVPVPPVNVHRMAGEDPDPLRAARKYEEELRAFFGEALPRFDLVLLGLGEEGHTASLFPDSPALEERERLVAAPYVDKLRAYRLTLTLPVLNAAARVAFLAAGKSKRAILPQVLYGTGTVPVPAQRVRPLQGALLWFIDEEAGADLPREASAQP